MWHILSNKTSEYQIFIFENILFIDPFDRKFQRTKKIFMVDIVIYLSV